MASISEMIPSIIEPDGDKWSQLERLQILLSVSGIVGLLKYLESVFDNQRPGAGEFQTRASTDEIFRMIRSAYDAEAASGQPIESMMQDFSAQVPGPAVQPTPTSSLSVREVEVLQLMAQGAANKEIASTLSIGQSTVKTHVAHIFEKLEVNRRTEAVTEALRQGIIALRPQPSVL